MMIKHPVELKLHRVLKRMFTYDKKKYTVRKDTTAAELRYRILHAKNNVGVVMWKNYTGNFVEKNELICNIIQNDGTATAILTPTKGVIANRFIEEGSHASEKSLLCLIKVSDKPRVIYRDLEKFKQNFYNKLDTDSTRVVDERRVQTKIFIPLKQDKLQLEQSLEEEVFDSKTLDTYKKIFVGILDKRRKEEYEKYIPQEVRDEEEEINRSVAKVAQEDASDKINRGDFQDIINENFSRNVDVNVNTLNEGVKNKYMAATMEIDMSSIIYNIVRKRESSDLKLELKCRMIEAAVAAINEIPNFKTLQENEANSFNIRVGVLGGTTLGFPLLTNINTLGGSQLKQRLLKEERDLAEGSSTMSQNDYQDEALTISNDWDFGSITGPSCLYLSKRSTLALNTVIMKPVQTERLKLQFRPVMSVSLTFNNTNITGQDALLFLNKIKGKFEDPNYIFDE